MKPFKHLLVAAAMTAAVPAAAQAPLEASVTIDLAHPGPKIEPAVYGQFAEHLGRGIYEGLWVGEDSPIARRDAPIDNVSVPPSVSTWMSQVCGPRWSKSNSTRTGAPSCL